ncbi:MAG: exo-alpha-sialidase [Clostridia bacterium]|nr:exo-alpha-sialidase [Clostridia bacterium]
MKNSIFSPDHKTEKPYIRIDGQEILSPAAVIRASDASAEALSRGEAFAAEIEARFIADFENSVTDKMVHVSTFMVIDGIIYMTYYANTQTAAENPEHQTARLVHCPADNPADMTFLDIQTVGDRCSGERVNLVYDTILARRDADTLYILWTAKVGDTYYRLYRPYYISTGTLGEVGVNRLQVGNVVNDFSTTGILSGLAENGIGCKQMYSDIGIMQKFTARVENGVTYYYTGAYSGDCNMLIKSRDFITWEYVSQPSFPNLSKWENAVYVLDGKCYYFVRQHDTTKYGFLTAYDLEKDTWEMPVLVEDCQSRGDFILYGGELYLFHAPIDREHIGILHIDRKNLAGSRIVLQAKMHSSCFYPFIQYFDNDGLAMSYTVARQHIRLARFTMENYL